MRIRRPLSLLARFSSAALLCAALLPGAQAADTAAAPADVVTSTAASPDKTAANIKQLLEQRFSGLAIDAVAPTAYPNLFEVRIGPDLLYTDTTAAFILDGTLVDVATRRNVTQERQEALLAVPFDSLPLELAFKQVIGDGSRRVAVFEDPNCGYCKVLRRTLQEVKDVTLYTFMYPILSPDSTDKVKNIWCASDSAATWDAWMLKGRVPPSATCDAPIDAMVALGRSLNVQGTPTMIFADGSRASGALPLASLRARLDAIKP